MLHRRKKYGGGEEEKYMEFGEKRSVVVPMEIYETSGGEERRAL